MLQLYSHSLAGRGGATATLTHPRGPCCGESASLKGPEGRLFRGLLKHMWERNDARRSVPNLFTGLRMADLHGGSGRAIHHCTLGETLCCRPWGQPGQSAHGKGLCGLHSLGSCSATKEKLSSLVLVAEKFKAKFGFTSSSYMGPLPCVFLFASPLSGTYLTLWHCQLQSFLEKQGKWVKWAHPLVNRSLRTVHEGCPAGQLLAGMKGWPEGSTDVPRKQT